MCRQGWRVLGLFLGLASVAPPARAQEAAPGGELPPVGFGSLKQDNVSLRVSVNDFEVRFIPLDERLIRLLGSDAYQSLHMLVASRRGPIDSAARDAGVASPGLALVTFFALRSGAQFDPDNFTLSYHNQFERPVAIVPYTTNFNSRQLDVRQQASAIYMFRLPIPVYDRFDVLYSTTAQITWGDEIVGRIGVERSRVLSKWQAAQGDTTGPRP
jgi:hypothetical protein